MAFTQRGLSGGLAYVGSAHSRATGGHRGSRGLEQWPPTWCPAAGPLPCCWAEWMSERRQDHHYAHAAEEEVVA